MLHERGHRSERPRSTAGEQPLLTARGEPAQQPRPAQPTDTQKCSFKAPCDGLDLLKEAVSYDGIISNFFKEEIIASWDCSFKQLVACNNGLLGLSPQAA